jgi:redox-sensitive bicupin YhaK (pirin superfamily)
MIDLIIDKRTRDLGGGFEVGRVLPFAKRRMVGPFIFFDHMGPIEMAPGIPREFDVRPHPHIGLSTVTYLYNGAMTHRDSLGYEQEIRPGEVNWMVAGRGITHSERLEYARRHGTVMHGIQAWVALPDGQEEIDPSFSHHDGLDLPQWDEDGVLGRLIAGAVDGVSARVRTQSPLFYLHWEMAPGARRDIGDRYAERAVYVAAGSATVGDVTLRAGQMAVLKPGGRVTVTADGPATVMVLGGDPVGERFLYWNFVSSSKARLEQAKEDWRQGRMALPIGDADEFVPLPSGLG